MTNTVSLADYRRNKTNKKLERFGSAAARVLGAFFRIALHLIFFAFCLSMSYGAYQSKLYDISAHTAAIAILVFITVRLPLKRLEECAQCLGYAFAVWLAVSGIAEFVAEFFRISNFHDNMVVQLVFGIGGFILLSLPFLVALHYYISPEPPPVRGTVFF